MRTELRERYRRRVSHKRNVVRVRYLSQSREISHLQLRVCYYFEKYAAGVILHSSAHFVEVRRSHRCVVTPKRGSVFVSSE